MFLVFRQNPLLFASKLIETLRFNDLAITRGMDVLSNTLFFLYFARRGVWEAHTRYQAPEGATSRKLTCFAAKLALGEVL